jgi:glycosyltransferase involved in cell wall biosynthesis
MRRLVDAPELAESMGRQARALVSERFSLDLSIAALWSIIERAIAEQRRKPPSGAAER